MMAATGPARPISERSDGKTGAKTYNASLLPFHSLTMEIQKPLPYKRLSLKGKVALITGKVYVL
jgi:hypothetical protein